MQFHSVGYGPSVHVDDAIFRQLDSSKYNVAWLAESSAIIPQVIEHVKQNTNNVLDAYDMFITHDLRLLPISPKFRYVPTNALPWVQNKQIYPKTKMISMIGSAKTLCPGHEFRQEIINKYSEQIDHFGNGFPGNELPWTYVDESRNIESGKLLGLKDYRFSIAMENDNYDVILCEKITDCFLTGTIPIYYGCPNIDEFFDINGIIAFTTQEELDQILNTLTPELYESKLHSVKANFERAFNYPTDTNSMYKLYYKEII